MIPLCSFLRHPALTMSLPDSSLTSIIAAEFFSGYETDEGIRIARPDSRDLAERHGLKPIQINDLITNGNWAKTRTQRDLELRAEGASIKEKCEHLLTDIIESVEKLMAKGRIEPTAADGIRAAKELALLNNITESDGVAAYREIYFRMKETIAKEPE